MDAPSSGGLDPFVRGTAPAWMAEGDGQTAVVRAVAVYAVPILSFLLAWAVDRSAAADGRRPRWFGTLRTRLTIVVCLTLAALIPLAA